MAFKDAATVRKAVDALQAEKIDKVSLNLEERYASVQKLILAAASAGGYKVGLSLTDYDDGVLNPFYTESKPESATNPKYWKQPLQYYDDNEGQTLIGFLTDLGYSAKYVDEIYGRQNLIISWAEE